MTGERTCEFNQAGLIRNAKQRAADGLQSRLLGGFGIGLRSCLLLDLHRDDLSLGMTSKV
jgi:hypothetical protein